MGQAQGQREPLQHPAEHQAGHRQGGLHRVADQLGQPEVGLPVRVRHPAGVQEHERAPLGQQRPQLVVDRVVEVPAAAAAADGDAGHAELVQRSAGLVGGARPAERHRAEPEQPVRCVGHVGGQLVVALGHDPGGELPIIRSGAEQERRQRDRVPAHADVVHLGQPHVHVVLGAGQRQRSHRTDPADPGVEPDDAVRHPAEVGQPALGEPLQQRQRHRVRVHVERATVGRGDRGALAPPEPLIAHRFVPSYRPVSCPTVAPGRGPVAAPLTGRKPSGHRERTPGSADPAGHCLRAQGNPGPGRIGLIAPEARDPPEEQRSSRHDHTRRR